METMNFDALAQRIWGILGDEKNPKYPRIVNIMTAADMNVFRQRFNTPSVTKWQVSRYCENDENPALDRLWNDLAAAQDEKTLFLYGFDSLLKLQGSERLERFFKNFLSIARNGNTILVTFQCRQYLQNITEPKYSRLIYTAIGNITAAPKITLRSPDLPGTEGVQGFRHLPDALESGSSDALTVITQRRAVDFPASLFVLKEESNFYDAVCQTDPILRGIREDSGSEENWRQLLHDLPENQNSFQRLVENKIAQVGNLAIGMRHWADLKAYERWLYLIALKVFGIKNDWCLHLAIQNADTPDQFESEIYRTIFTLESADRNYWGKYELWREKLNFIKKNSAAAKSFAQIVRGHGKDGLRQLSNASIYEKELIFELLDKFGHEFPYTELCEILRHVYPDLFDYLQDYPLRNELLDRYFHLYRYQKVINKLLPDFEAIVEDQAREEKHDFIKQQARSSVLDQLDFNQSETYFMDAMGMEFLGYLAALCKNENLRMNVRVCKAELPSDTEHNKGFVDELRSKGIQVYENGLLDELKHGKNQNYNYEKTKLPIHMIEEFEILSRVVHQSALTLSKNEIKKIYLIPDHGSSRMAIIKENPAIIPMELTGTHGGRNCPWQQGMENIPQAVIDNDFYSMANYDRFKGSHISGVELHGGASLEEVVIPMITLQLQGVSYEIELLTPVITVSFKDKGTIRFASNVHLDHVQIRVEGELLDAVPDGTNTFSAALTQKLKADKDYSFDVLENGSEIQSGLTFHVQSRMGREKDLF